LAGDALRRPRGLLRNRHLQSLWSVLPTLGALRRRSAGLRAASQPLLLDCGRGTRLQAFYSSSPQGTAPRARRLALLLHGWEGSADARCVLSLAAVLYQSGFEVLRLNLRDHGATHHLNREIFHSCRLDDVSGALDAIAMRFPRALLYLAGFSLGGNFWLRAAAQAGLPEGIRGIVAISPVLDPARTLEALERGPQLYQRYLQQRWARSLRLKQRAWPGAHDFRAALRAVDLRHMTAALVPQHTPYASVEEYLEGYALSAQRLARIRIPCGVLLAEDDPLVPIEQLAELPLPASVQLQRTRYGGHCGFVERVRSATLAERFVLEQFARFDEPGHAAARTVPHSDAPAA
jgi:uncharacterized protein